jgi:ATP-dependent protease HslVU (ClpYQ) peptidase subunit
MHSVSSSPKKISTVVCRAEIFLLIVGQNTLMSVERDRVLAMGPGDPFAKVAAVPLAVIWAAQ